MKWLKHRSIQILLLTLLYMSTASLLPKEAHQFFYTISLFLKDLLLWMLPITVAFFLANTVASFEKKAPLFLLVLLAFETLSNLSSVWYAYFCGHATIPYFSQLNLHDTTASFDPLWRLPFIRPSWWAADKGSFLGIAFGLIASFIKPSFKPLLQWGKDRVEWVLTNCFSRLIPVFVLGFIAKMQQTNLVYKIFYQYADLLFWLILFLTFYILFLFFLGSGPSFKTFLRHIKNLLPSMSISFSSGCSLSTMPWTIDGTAKNLENPELAKAIIPATTNIQQIGDCIANTFLCFLLFFTFHGTPPDLSTWISFSLVFVLARFATAAVLGGAIFIMLPIYETYLHFTPEMISLILAFNVILDPLITSANVVANGALCRIFEKTWSYVLKKSVIPKMD